MQKFLHINLDFKSRMKNIHTIPDAKRLSQQKISVLETIYNAGLPNFIKKKLIMNFFEDKFTINLIFLIILNIIFYYFFNKIKYDISNVKIIFKDPLVLNLFKHFREVFTFQVNYYKRYYELNVRDILMAKYLKNYEFKDLLMNSHLIINSMSNNQFLLEMMNKLMKNNIKLNELNILQDFSIEFIKVTNINSKYFNKINIEIYFQNLLYLLIFLIFVGFSLLIIKIFTRNVIRSYEMYINIITLNSSLISIMFQFKCLEVFFKFFMFDLYFNFFNSLFDTLEITIILLYWKIFKITMKKFFFSFILLETILIYFHIASFKIGPFQNYIFSYFIYESKIASRIFLIFYLIYEKSREADLKNLKEVNKSLINTIEHLDNFLLIIDENFSAYSNKFCKDLFKSLPNQINLLEEDKKEIKNLKLIINQLIYFFKDFEININLPFSLRLILQKINEHLYGFEKENFLNYNYRVKDYSKDLYQNGGNFLFNFEKGSFLKQKNPFFNQDKKRIKENNIISEELDKFKFLLEDLFIFLKNFNDKNLTCEIKEIEIDKNISSLNSKKTLSIKNLKLSKFSTQNKDLSKKINILENGMILIGRRNAKIMNTTKNNENKNYFENLFIRYNEFSKSMEFIKNNEIRVIENTSNIKSKFEEDSKLIKNDEMRILFKNYLTKLCHEFRNPLLNIIEMTKIIKIQHKSKEKFIESSVSSSDVLSNENNESLNLRSSSLLNMNKKILDDNQVNESLKRNYTNFSKVNNNDNKNSLIKGESKKNYYYSLFNNKDNKFLKFNSNNVSVNENENNLKENCYSNDQLKSANIQPEKLKIFSMFKDRKNLFGIRRRSVLRRNATLLSNNQISNGEVLNVLKKVKLISNYLNNGLFEMEQLSNLIFENDINTHLFKLKAKSQETMAFINIYKEIEFLSNMINTKISLSNPFLKFFYEIDNNVSNKLLIDFETIKKMLLLLISNSIKFTKSGRIKLKIKNEKDNLSFKIIDQGIGIKKEDLKLLGNLFFHKKSCNNFHGIGVGMFLFKLYLNALEGFSSIESELGKGTIVKFHIPLNNNDIYSKNEGKNLIFEEKQKITSGNVENIKRLNSSFDNKFNRNFQKTKKFSGLPSKSQNYNEEEKQKNKHKHNSKSDSTLKTLKMNNPVINVIYNSYNYFQSQKNFNNESSGKNFFLEFLKQNTLHESKSINIKSSDITQKSKNYFETSNHSNKLTKTQIHPVNNLKIIDISENNNNEKNSINHTIMKCKTRMKSRLNFLIESDRSKCMSSNKKKISPNVSKIEKVTTLNNERDNYLNINYNDVEINMSSFRKRSYDRFNSDIYHDKSDTKIYILIVDDEELIRRSNVNFCRKYYKDFSIHKYEVHIDEAPDGIEALYKVYQSYSNDFRYDIIITDENMNFMKGSLLANIMKNFMNENIIYKITIGLLTSYEKSILEEQNYMKDFDLIGTKPISRLYLDKLMMKIHTK